MIPHSYVTDSQAKSTELAATITAAATPPQILAACTALESYLRKHTPDQQRWFFSITFPNLICKIFGFDDSSSSAAASSPTRPQVPSGWINIATSSNNSELCGRIFSLLSPKGILFSSISAVDRLSLVKYVFPTERLPEWVRYMLQSERDSRILADLCLLFKNRVKEDKISGSPCQVQLNVFEYYMFWFAYFPVCRGNTEGAETVKTHRTKKFRLENWAASIPGLSSTKRGTQQKTEGNLYIRLLYAYLHAFISLHDVSFHQPYRSSLLHYPLGYDSSVAEQAEFLVYTWIHFWLVDNDFSPLPVSVMKSYGVTFPFRSVLGETPPTAGIGEVLNVLVKYLNLISGPVTEGSRHVEHRGPEWRVLGPIDVKLRDTNLSLPASGSWNSWIQRPLYRFILRTFLFCPVDTSIKNASQAFTLWINYMEPWMSNLEEFADIDEQLQMSTGLTANKISGSLSNGYSSSWQGFVLANYLFYSSLVVHFIGFAHKFLHTEPEVIVQMVAKVIHILTSSKELMELIKNVDSVFHTKPAESSRSLLSSALQRFVPSIREQLQDWEYGLCESDADGSFLHENWNKDLRLFSDGEDGGQHLLQLFLLRAESELQAISGDLQSLDPLKVQIGQLFGGSITRSRSGIPEPKHHEKLRDELFKPKSFGNRMKPDVKYKGDWMKRPISNDEVAWLAKWLVNLSAWLNESLGLNETCAQTQPNPPYSYVDLSGANRSELGPMETMKLLFCSLSSWIMMLRRAGLKFTRDHGLRVNLRVVASKKVVMMLLVIAAFSLIKRCLAV